MARKSASKWDLASERAFLELWAGKMNKLLACRKNSHILLEMGLELEEAGFTYTLIELKTKMHNLSARFRKERNQVRATGMPSAWEHYADMEDILAQYENQRGEAHDDTRSVKKNNKGWKSSYHRNSQTGSESHHNDSDIDDQSEDDENNIEVFSQTDEDFSTKTSFISVPGMSKYPKNPLSDNRIAKKFKLSRSTIAEIDKNDDIDLFFLSMAKTIKKLPHHEQINLKQNISSLVFQAELNNISNDKS